MKDSHKEYDVAYTATREIHIPHVKIGVDDPTYVYVPCRGYSATMAVFDTEDKCVGWIHIHTLGYNSVDEWMKATNWIDQGY